MNTLSPAHKNRELITKINGITDYAYSELIFKTGMAYLDIYLGGDEKLINDFATHKQYWSWWKLQYAIIDEAWLNTHAYSGEKGLDLLRTYTYMHINMKKDIDAVVWQSMQESRDNMIQAIIQDAVATL
ncbi:MAG: hypothetical protein QM503_04695 [Bacteroidota bacterium]